MSKITRDSEVREIMTSDVGSVTEHAFVSITEVMRDSIKVRHTPVVDAKNKPVGIICVRDILNHYKTISADGRVSVPEVMTTPVVSVEASAPLSEVAALMSMHRISSIVIVEEEELSGIVTERDFLKLAL